MKKEETFLDPNFGIEDITYPYGKQEKNEFNFLNNNEEDKKNIINKNKKESFFIPNFGIEDITYPYGKQEESELISINSTNEGKT